MALQETFHALGDETRREILRLLRQGTMTAGEITAHFSMSAATISHHLNILRQAGLVSDTRRGKFICYTLNTSVFEEVMLWIDELGGEHI